MAFPCLEEVWELVGAWADVNIGQKRERERKARKTLRDTSMIRWWIHRICNVNLAGGNAIDQEWARKILHTKGTGDKTPQTKREVFHSLVVAFFFLLFISPKLNTKRRSHPSRKWREKKSEGCHRKKRARKNMHPSTVFLSKFSTDSSSSYPICIGNRKGTWLHPSLFAVIPGGCLCLCCLCVVLAVCV